MILSKHYILNKFYSNPVSSKSSVQRFSGVPGRNGVCLVSDWSFGCMDPGKRNRSVNLWIPSCINSTTAQNLNILNYARGMKKHFKFEMCSSLIMPTPSFCSRDPAFGLFCFVFNYRLFRLSIWNFLIKFLKLRYIKKNSTQRFL